MNDLDFIFDRFFTVTNLPLRAIDSTSNQIIASKGYKSTVDPFNGSNVKSLIMHKSFSNCNPFIFIEDIFCAYGALHGPDEVIVILGPVMLRHMTKQDIQDFAFKHHLSAHDVITSPFTLFQITAALSLLHFMFYDECLNDDLITIDSTAKSYIPLSQHVELLNHIPQNIDEDILDSILKQEVQYLQLIREGKVEDISNKEDRSFNPNSIGFMVKKSYKNFEYMICSSIALSTRAAVEGGLDRAKAMALNILFLQRLELCSSIDDIIKLQIEIKLAFAKEVKTARENRCALSYVEKCKHLITNNLSKAISLIEIAEALNVNEAYLARKFKSETGMTVMEYLRNKRIEAAARMLKFSDDSISSISNYLCFSSQSHFSLVFRKIMAMSPQKYRNKESVI